MDRGPKICKKCGHECHCDEVNCPKCANDVCGWCDCGEDVMLGTDARSWPGFMDSGLDRLEQ